jgi:hypothetical protein
MPPTCPPVFDRPAEGEQTEILDTPKGSIMNGLKIVAIALIAAGVLGLIYGGFTYTKKTHEAKIGSVEMTMNEREKVNVPLWADVGAVVAGVALLLVGSKRN